MQRQSSTRTHDANVGIDVRATLLGGMGGLFFRVMLRRSKNRQSVPIPARTPRLPRLSLISARVMAGVSATRARMMSACASTRPDRRSPPCVRGSNVPVVRYCWHQRIALDALTPKRSPARRHDIASIIASITRRRRSTVSALAMHAGLLHQHAT